MSEKRDLDRLIGAALETYADPYRDDLAEKVLTRLANEPAAPPRRAWLPWAAFSFAAAICLLLLVYSEVTKPHAAPQIQSAQLHNPAGISVRSHSDAARSPEAARQINRIAPHPQPLAATTVSEPLPKLDVFPAPTPLTRQESDLAVYIAHAPQAEQEALAKSEQEPMPLTVASIHVMPLEVMPLEAPDGGANTN